MAHTLLFATGTKVAYRTQLLLSGVRSPMENYSGALRIWENHPYSLGREFQYAIPFSAVSSLVRPISISMVAASANFEGIHK